MSNAVASGDRPPPRPSIPRIGEQSSSIELDRTVRVRIEDGAHCLQAIGGRDYDRPLKKVAAVSPDMADLLLAFPYGDVMSRPGLSLRQRQICTVAMLLAHRSAQAQLRFHMRGLLNVGGSIDDLVALLVMASGLLGFPTAIAGVPIVRDLIAETGVAYAPAERQPAGVDERFERGAQAIRALLHIEPEAYAAAFSGISPLLAEWTVEFEFGEVLGRSGLDRVSKHLASLMMLAMRGNSEDRLLLHLSGAVADNVPRTAIIEALIQLAVYGGFPTALNAFGVAGKVFAGSAAPEGDAPAPGAISRAEPFDRTARGLATLEATSGGSGDAVVKSFAGVAPGIGAMIVDHAYGDIFARPGLDPKTRELTACAALAAMGSVDEEPLGVHVKAARTLGATETEVFEAILNIAPYAGYPAAQRAIVVAAAAMHSADER